MNARPHVLELLSRQNGTVETILNGRPVKSRWLIIKYGIYSKQTEVELEVIQEPYVVIGDEVKSWVWHLAPCSVKGDLPGRLFQ